MGTTLKENYNVKIVLKAFKVINGKVKGLSWKCRLFFSLHPFVCALSKSSKQNPLAFNSSPSPPPPLHSLLAWSIYVILSNLIIMTFYVPRTNHCALGLQMHSALFFLDCSLIELVALTFSELGKHSGKSNLLRTNEDIHSYTDLFPLFVEKVYFPQNFISMYMSKKKKIK